MKMSKAIEFFSNFYHGVINILIITGALLLIGGCDSSEDSSGPRKIIVSIEQSGVINKSNLASYNFSGKCPKNDEDVSITIGSSSSRTASCSKNTWELLAVNLTSLVTNGRDIVLTVVADDEEVELSFAVDIVAPTTTIALENTGKNLVNEAFNVVVNFSEDVTSFDQATDVAITGPLVASAPRSVSGSKRSYKVTLTPMANKNGEGATVTVSASVAQDLGGNNNQAVNQGVTVTVDNVPPAAPASLALSSPAASPGNDSTPIIKVTGVNGDVIELFTDSGCSQSVGKASVTDGNALVTTSDIGSNGDYEFYAQATDGAGNTSSCSSANNKLSYTLNKTLIQVTLSRPGGNNPPVNGAFSINIVFGSGVTGFVVGEITVTGGSAGSLTGSSTNYSATITPANQVSEVVVTVAHGVAQDTNNNAQVNQAAEAFTVVVDRTVPLIQSVAGVAGSYRAGAQINLTVTFSEKVVVAANPTLALTVGNDSSISASYQSGSGTAHIFRYTVGASDTDVNGIVVTALNLTSGATIRDLAGNNLNTNLSSTTLSSILVDNTAPAVPSTIAFISGFTSPSKDNTPSIEVGGTNGDTIELFTNSGCTQSVGSTTVSSGKASITTSPLGSDGSYSFYAKATDLAGNSSNCSSNKLDYQLDTTAPAVPTSIAFVSGLSSPGNDNTPSIEVTGTNGDTIELFTNVACTQSVGSATVGSGKATIATTTLTSDKVYSFYAKATDPVGNSSNCSSIKLDYQLDTTAPAVPTSLALVSSLTSPGSDSTPTIEVTGTNGDTIGLFTNAACTQSVGSETVGSGKASITTSTLDSDGSYSFYAKATDPVGNQSNCSTNSASYFLQMHFILSKIDLGDYHGCAVLSNGEVRCWGNGENGELGNDASTMSNHPVAVVTQAGSTNHLSNVLQVSSGGQHSCALTLAGGVKCWGNGNNGRLGNNASSHENNPVDVDSSDGVSSNLGSIAQVSTGGKHTCALSFNRGVKCWGNGDSGQLGNKGNTDQDAPVDVKLENNSNLSSIVKVSSGKNHTCALSSIGEVKCWGMGASGQLGNNSTGNKNFAVNVKNATSSTANLKEIVQISVGDDHTCALTIAGRVKCWGAGSNGRLGNGSDSANKSYPVNVVELVSQSPVPLTDVVQISSGGLHTCALKANGQVRCWGRGASGQLGTVSVTGSNYPVVVIAGDGVTSPLGGIVQVACGGRHTCLLDNNGQLRCMGMAGNGQLGDQATTSRNYPVLVAAGSTGLGALNAGTFRRSYRCINNTCSLDTIGISLAATTPSPGSNSTPTVKVSAAVVGQTVRFYSDRWCSVSAGANTASSTSTSAALSAVSEGVHQFYFEVTRPSNPSLGCSKSSLYYIFDQTVPQTPGIALASASSGTTAQSAGSNATPSVNIALGNIGDVLKVYKDSSCSASELAAARVYRPSFSLTLAALAADGTYQFYAQATDRAGNKSACSSATASYYLDLP